MRYLFCVNSGYRFPVSHLPVQGGLSSGSGSGENAEYVRNLTPTVEFPWWPCHSSFKAMCCAFQNFCKIASSYVDFFFWRPVRSCPVDICYSQCPEHQNQYYLRGYWTGVSGPTYWVRICVGTGSPSDSLALVSFRSTGLYSCRLLPHRTCNSLCVCIIPPPMLILICSQDLFQFSVMILFTFQLSLYLIRRILQKRYEEN